MSNSSKEPQFTSRRSSQRFVIANSNEESKKDEIAKLRVNNGDQIDKKAASSHSKAAPRSDEETCVEVTTPKNNKKSAQTGGKIFFLNYGK